MGSLPGPSAVLHVGHTYRSLSNTHTSICSTSSPAVCFHRRQQRRTAAANGAICRYTSGAGATSAASTAAGPSARTAVPSPPKPAAAPAGRCCTAGHRRQRLCAAHASLQSGSGGTSVSTANPAEPSAGEGGGRAFNNGSANGASSNGRPMNGGNGASSNGSGPNLSRAGLYADLVGAPPYSNGSSSTNGLPGAPTVAAAAPITGGDEPGDEVCVFEIGPDGATMVNCVPMAGMGATVSSVMQAMPGATAAAAAAATATTGADLAAAGHLASSAGVAAAAAAGATSAALTDMASTSDVRGSTTGSIDLLGDVEDHLRGGNAINVARSSVDKEDTPEGLTDVEATSVAPVADWFKDQEDITTLTYAVLTGGVVAGAVFAFDVTIQTIHDLPDILQGVGIGGGRKTGLEIFDIAIPFRCVMPVAAGVAVAWLQSRGFAPALKALTRATEGVTDDRTKVSTPTSYWQVFRKAAASAITLGSGASLGPEAPSVELGANTAALMAPKQLNKRKQRMLIAAGAAAGVSAAFDAPVSGALFAVEFVLKSSRLGLDRLSTSTVFVSTSVAAGVIGFLRTQGQALGIAGAATHLVGRIPYFSIQPNLLVDVLQFSALGLGCSVAAVALYEGVRVSEIALRPLPRWLSAPTAGALCGLIAYPFPQVQYGYVNLEEIFRDSTRMSATDLAALLTAKIVATSLCVGGGLVGGLFAPSLFLGALVGDLMGHFFAGPWGLPDPTSLVVVGAAAVLGAACRAPLTAVALMVEITRDTGLLVPLLAAIGVSSLFTDYMEGIFSKRLEQALVELYLREKAFFWAASLVDTAPQPAGGAGGGTKTVEQILAAPARLYVRHTLPLAQAKDAMIAKNSPAAVVVDDNFSPKGVVFLEDVEAELMRQKLLNEPDANFNRSYGSR